MSYVLLKFSLMIFIVPQASYFNYTLLNCEHTRCRKDEKECQFDSRSLHFFLITKCYDFFYICFLLKWMNLCDGYM